MIRVKSTWNFGGAFIISVFVFPSELNEGAAFRLEAGMD